MNTISYFCLRYLEHPGCFKLGRMRAVMTAMLLLVGSAAAEINIETVPVGNPGNAADTEAHSGNSNGQGAVNYHYRIGKYEVTAGQYTALLNAVAATDTYELYNSSMADTALGSGITRSGSSGSYTHAVDSAFVNRPVNYVTFWDGARFANWLHNGQPTGTQNNSTTEDGAYTLTVSGINGNSVARNVNWKWTVTSEDEWYKAAYHKNDGETGNYFLYPTSSDSTPGRDLTDVSGNNANSIGTPYPIQSPYYTTLAGEFQSSPSPYNTFDQGGNVLEWNEFTAGSLRGLRGGAFSGANSYLLSSTRGFVTKGEASNIGFSCVPSA